MPLNNGVYKSMMNLQAYKQLINPAYIPNPNLFIDNASENQPYNLSYYRLTPNSRQTVVIPDPTFFPIEETATNFNGNPVKREDFPQEFYLGNPIGGF
jgi:hypothetical protein